MGLDSRTGIERCEIMSYYLKLKDEVVDDLMKDKKQECEFREKVKDIYGGDEGTLYFTCIEDKCTSIVYSEVVECECPSTEKN